MVRKTVEDKKRELIAGLIAARSSVLAAAQSLPADRQDTLFLGAWSLKELLAHLIGWDFTNIEAVQQIAAGQYPSFFQYADKDWHSYNHILVERYRQATLAESLSEAAASHRQLVFFLQNLDAKTVVNGKARSAKGRTVTIRNLLLSEADDELEHAKQVLAFLARKS